MIDTNRITIVVEDCTVVTDICSYQGLDFSNCGIPADVHALQWLHGIGEIEYCVIDNHKKMNEEISVLPPWAVKCLVEWQMAYDADPPPMYHVTM
jgi:hypothetical protein